MPDFSHHQMEIARSQEFFSDPANYAQFDLDRKARRAIGCIDPRDQEGEQLRTVIQTAGGAVGEGLDMAVALNVIDPTADMSIEDGIAADRNVRHTAKLCAHRSCKFIQGLPTVLGEMINPSDFTQESLDRWVNFYEFDDELTPAVFSAVRDGVQRISEHDYVEDNLLKFVDGIHGSTNVVDMTGENRARMYVVNHHPLVGLNRHRKHREAALQVQGYHDSLGAIIGDQLMSRTAHNVRTPRLAAHLLRAAAVRTVIGGATDDTVYLEVQMTNRGPSVQEIK